MSPHALLRHLLRLCCAAGLVAALSACGSGSTPNTTAQSVASLTLNGQIIFPPAAGQAVFTSGSGAQAVTVGEAEVAADGSYTMTLSAAPSAGGGRPLPTLPSAVWLGATDLTCNGTPTLSTAARTLLLDGGHFLSDGQKRGDLVLSAGIVGGEGKIGAQDAQVSLPLVVYADREVQASGNLACIFRDGQGQYNGVLQVSYHLNPGWNVLLVQTQYISATSVVTVSLSNSSQTLQTWRYQPTP